MNKTYLSLGSNLGDRIAYLSSAIKMLQEYGDLVKQSAYYESAPWGYQSEHSFINICVEWHTHLAPEACLDVFKEVENHFGRNQQKEHAVYTDRPVDVDLIFYNDLVINTKSLQLPHPRYQERKFVLLPLVELSPDRLDPISNQSIKSILDECTDTNDIQLFLSND